MCHLLVRLKIGSSCFFTRSSFGQNLETRPVRCKIDVNCYLMLPSLGHDAVAITVNVSSYFVRLFFLVLCGLRSDIIWKRDKENVRRWMVVVIWCCLPSDMMRWSLRKKGKDYKGLPDIIRKRGWYFNNSAKEYQVQIYLPVAKDGKLWDFKESFHEQDCNILCTFPATVVSNLCEPGQDRLKSHNWIQLFLVSDLCEPWQDWKVIIFAKNNYCGREYSDPKNRKRISYWLYTICGEIGEDKGRCLRCRPTNAGVEESKWVVEQNQNLGAGMFSTGKLRRNNQKKITQVIISDSRVVRAKKKKRKETATNETKSSEAVSFRFFRNITKLET